MTKRRSRRTRPARANCVITARDLEIVFAVGRMAQATTTQVRRLFFGQDKSTAARRLAKLAARRLLDVHVTSLNDENVYTLGAKATSTLQAHGFSTSELHRSRVR
jgi:hypothetical protein